LHPAEAEDFLLALLPTTALSVLRDQALTDVEPHDFWSAHHGALWAAARKLRDADQRITRRSLLAADDVKSTAAAERILDGLAAISAPGEFSQAVADVKRCGRLRRLVQAAQRIQQRALAADDPSVALMQAHDELRKLDSIEHPHTKARDYRDLLIQFEAAMRAEGDQFVVIPTPWPEFNERVAGGLHGGRLYVVGARPGQGKSIVAHQLAEHAAALGRPAMVFSAEMGTLEVIGRMVANGATIELDEISRRDLSSHSWKQFDEYKERAINFPIVVDDKPDLTLGYIRAEARAQKRRGGLDVVAVDYLQLIKPERNVSREQQVAEISRGLKQLSRELDVAVIVPAQLNRRADERPNPSLADLRESGAIEADADVVMLLARRLHEKTGKPTHLLGVHIGKNRHGRVGDIELTWRGQYSRLS
ncbi:MAG TPA: DnaB-like helicase C-terminal domain-containing protein, partial [Kribbella sp.]|uniref:replicative DNA helicase n=1 Tax=Kribbella sp. TaxID=1871183 RepID=UPI002D78A757